MGARTGQAQGEAGARTLLDWQPDGATAALQHIGTGWVDVPVPDGSSGRTVLRVRIRRDTVEVWFGERCDGVFDREQLRGWLAGQRDWLISDDVLLVAGPGFVAVAIRGRLAVGTVQADVLQQLREHV